MFKSWKPGALTLLFSFALLYGHARADSPLLDEVHTVAAFPLTLPTQTVPIEHSFAISTSGTYQVALVDLGAALLTPAPLNTLKLAITSGSTAVTLTLADGTTATELKAAGTAQFTASPGNYIVHVIGTLGTDKNGNLLTESGPIGITITNTSNSSQLEAYSDTLTFPSSVNTNEAVLDDSFSVVTTGTYQVTLTDMQLPTSLTDLQLAIAQQGGALVTTLAVVAPAATATGSVSLQAGVTYRIFAVGQQTGTPTAGLFGVNVQGAQSVYNNTVPVGAVTLLGSPLLTAGTATLTLADLLYPGNNALSATGTAVTLNGQSVVTPLGTPGSTTFTATATNYQVYGFGVPSSSTTQGSYAVTLTSAAGTPVLDLARAVSTPGGTDYTYSYDSSITTAGTYTVDLADFGYPANLSSVSVAVIQGSKLVGSALSSGGVAGSGSATVAAGPVSVLAFATLGTSATGGLFGADLTAAGASSPTFETSQGVGQLFTLHQVSVTTAGSYLLTVNDVGFPASFENLAVIVTRGTSNITQVFGGGSQIINATPGTYDINIVATPGGADEAGTYAVTFDTAPPAPTITFSPAPPTSVDSGSTVTLSWSSTNATACALSGGSFSNTTEPTSGSATSAAITAATTFTLTCTGGGQSTSQSATVNITSSTPAGGGHGGGGAIRPDLLVLLLGSILLRTVGSQGVRKPRWSRFLPTGRFAQNAS